MIGAVLSWNGAGLEKIGAKRFASALQCGLTAPTYVEKNGFLLAFSTPNQHHSTGDFNVLFYGHIDNHSALRQQLKLKGASDAEIYWEAYHLWGDRVDQYVIGRYSTIICDILGKQLRVSRSPIKAPSLYISRVSDQIIIATTPKAIFATGKVVRKLDDQKVADSLIQNYWEETRGWFENVRRFRRAHYNLIRPDGEKEVCYWRLEDIRPVRFKQDTDYVDAAETLFREAVAASLDGFTRPAISLSGGLDSQAVAVYTMALRPDQPLLAYTSIPAYDGEFISRTRFGNERAHVEALANMYPQLETNWITAAGLDMSHHLNDLFDEAMLPPRNALNLHWIHEIYKSAKAAGADVLLFGAMGNLTFSYDGKAVIPELLRRRKFQALLREIHTGGLGTLKTAVKSQLPQDVLKIYRRMRRSREEMVSMQWSPIHPSFAREMNVKQRAQELGYDPEYGMPNSLLDHRRRLLSNSMTENGDLAYGLQRLHNMPVRDPTAFRPLLEFCFAIPPEQYLHRGEGRWLARRMLRGKIPNFIVDERRKGIQAADYGERIRSKYSEILEEIEWLKNDESVSSKIDLDRIKRELISMNDSVVGRGHDLPWSSKLAITRALSTARFIRYLNRQNAP